MNTYKRVSLCVFLMFITLGYFSVTEAENQKTIIKVAGDENYPPFEFVDKDYENTYRGFNVDVMRAIGIEMGVEVQFVPMPWSEAKTALLNGEVDAIQGMIKTDSRIQLFDFTEAYYFSSQVLFVKADNQHIVGLEDLKGRSVAVQKGDVSDEIMVKTKEVQLKVFPDQESALMSMIEGQTVAVLGNRTTGIYHLQQMNLENSVKLVGETLSTADYACAVRKGDTETLALINAGLKQVKSKGTLRSINEKWFGESLADHMAWKSLLIVAVIIALTLAVLLSLIFLINKKLQKEVRLRTKELESSRSQLEIQNAQKWHILNSISNGIVVFDKNGKVTLFNENCRVIIDKDIEKNLHWSELNICRILGTEIFEKALVLKTIYSGNATIISELNETIYLHYTISPVAYTVDAENELILMIKDITQEKIFYEAMHQNDKLSTLGRMSASIAHEIRNPLSAIKQYADLLPAKIDNTKFVAQALQVIQTEVIRLNEIIDGLLDYTKFTESRKDIISIDKLVDDLAMLMKVDFLQRRVKFNTEFETYALYADPKQMKQVLINLVVNALDALPDSGGSITIKSYLKTQMFVIEVIDSGRGIPAEYLDRVFEPYFTTKTSGFGMGLAISKQMVEENGGELHIQSTVGIGTIIQLVFPISV